MKRKRHTPEQIVTRLREAADVGRCPPMLLLGDDGGAPSAPAAAEGGNAAPGRFAVVEPPDRPSQAVSGVDGMTRRKCCFVKCLRDSGVSSP